VVWGLWRVGRVGEVGSVLGGGGGEGGGGGVAFDGGDAKLPSKRRRSRPKERNYSQECV